MSRSFADLIRDYEADPARWEVVQVDMKPSTSVRNRGGTSVQAVLKNRDTGEVVVRHTLRRTDGSNFAPPHFRPSLK
jgi:hypothetical protein